MHKIIKFNDKNTELGKMNTVPRKESKIIWMQNKKKTRNDFDKKKFFRLMKNAVFGKVI